MIEICKLLLRIFDSKQTDIPTIEEPSTEPGQDMPEIITEEIEVPKSTLPITPRQKFVIESVLSQFETGIPSGDYGAIAVLPDGAGISYGKHQATDGGDNLDEIVYRYIDRGGAFANMISNGKFLEMLYADETTKIDPNAIPEDIKYFMTLLQNAGREDPIMRQVQDDVFDEKYWVPAVGHATDMQLITGLAWLVIYDTCIHSGPSGVTKIRQMFLEVPPSRGGDEKKWVQAYVTARYNWLANYPNSFVARTKHRMVVMQNLIDDNNWDLITPFEISGSMIVGPPI